MTAILLLDQVGLPAGSAGFARTDGLRTGVQVTVKSVGQAQTHEARILTLPEADSDALSSFTQQDLTTWAFTPTPGVDGMYRIELVTDRGLPSQSRQVRVFGIRDANGRLFPSYGLVADLSANRPDLSDPAKLLEFVLGNELNEPTAKYPDGNPFGWSLELDALLRGAAQGGAPAPADGEFLYSDDFAEGIRAAAADGPNQTVLAVGGTVTTPSASFDPQISLGWGWANLTVPNAGGASARLQLRNDMILARAGITTVFKARIKLPASFADVTPLVGMADAGDFSFARLFVDAAGFWVRSVKSSNGGAQNDTVTATAASAGKVYDVRIELVAATSVAFFVQQLGMAEVALGIENTPNTIPDSIDALGLFAAILHQANLGTLSIDWWIVSGGR